MADTKASPAKIRKATKIAAWKESGTLFKYGMLFIQHDRHEYSINILDIKSTLYMLMNALVCVRLTYVAVDGVCISHYGAVHHGGVVQIFHPQRVVTVLPEVEWDPEIKNETLYQAENQPD